jgi:MinD-like ATPase involved in chromosome partitioning or flagellar assembly/tetratricopeptide (TPR) repeat protein
MPDVSKESPDGRIVTFYSYKGGTGRTMALANVAWILAANGYRVLAADWDLESPGLHRFLYPFLEHVVRDAEGIIDFIREYEWLAAKTKDKAQREKHITDKAKIEHYAFSLNWSFSGGGHLDFLSPGKQDGNYAATLGAMDWDNFYAALNGGKFLDALREDMKQHYDYVLIDSRTGLSDVAEICTVHLPDVLVDCFTLSTQGIEGAAQVAKLIQEQYQHRAIRLLPVPMRVDLGEQERVQASRAFATRLFAGLPAGMSDVDRRMYWAAVEVPYRPYYAFEETLAVFGDTPGDPGSLLSSFERIASYITDGRVTSLPAMDEDLRSTARQRFVRRLPLEGNQVTVEFLPEDRLWAEWISSVLRDGGLTVRERRIAQPAAAGDGDQRTLTVVSPRYLERRQGQPELAPRSGYAVYVADSGSLDEFASSSSTFLANVRKEEAADRLRKLLGVTAVPEVRRVPATRYPGDEPRIIRVGIRNDAFTGREDTLQALREQLRGFGMAVTRPVALQGLGGVGKTAVALEYVHRFKNDYDLIWWVNCSQPEQVDIRLADLAQLMRGPYSLTLRVDATVEETVRIVLDALGQGGTAMNWLLVYDNAENVEAVRRYLPSGGGHVLITSQTAGWEDWGARKFPIELFQRDESIAHLRYAVPTLTREAAGQVAEALGDLPLALAAAAAYLKGSHYPVSDYLTSLQREAPRALSYSELADYRKGVAAAWDQSLNLLHERSPAASRLLELCAVMAPEVALDLVYSAAMAEALERFDPALSEPMIMGRVVQEASKLALLKLDTNAKQIVVHRLVQAVVRSRMSQEQLVTARHDVQQILVAARPRRDVQDKDTWERFRLLWPHLTPSDAVSSADASVRQLIIDRVRYIWVFSDFHRGLDEATAAANRWEEMLVVVSGSASSGSDGAALPAAKLLRTQLLQLRFNLGNIMRSLSRFQEARKLDGEVFAEQTALLETDHPHTLMTAGGLAADLRALGLYHEALEMDKKTYPAWTAQYGEDNPRTLSAANNLAVSYRVTGDVTAALRLDQGTLARLRATTGPQNTQTLLAARNVIRDQLEAGEYFQATESIEGVWQTCVKEFGPGSEAALDAQVLYGIALRSAGQASKAESPFREAQEILNDRFGESSSRALACRLSHAANLLSLEQVDAALAEIRHVLPEYERSLGHAHPHTLVCRVNLASALRLSSPLAQATEAIDAATVELERVLGPQHPYTLAAMMVFGVLLADQDDLARAEEVESRTVRSLARALGATHPDTLRCRANLLLTRQQRGDNAAKGERDAVISQLAELIGEDHPNIATLRGDRRLMRALDPQPF